MLILTMLMLTMVSEDRVRYSRVFVRLGLGIVLVRLGLGLGILLVRLGLGLGTYSFNNSYLLPQTREFSA